MHKQCKLMQVKETLPVYEAISVSNVEPLHCALDQSGYDDRQHKIKCGSRYTQAVNQCVELYRYLAWINGGLVYKKLGAAVNH